MKIIPSLYKRQYKNLKTKKTSNNLLDVFEDNQICKDSLKWFFELGYIPGKQTLFENIEKVKEDVFADKSSSQPNNFDFSAMSYDDIVKEGKNKICQSISELLNHDNKKIILPITSGLDSRILLGGLLENVSSDKITTLTWGIPEGIDCRVGAMISKKLGIKHHLMSLKDYQLTEKRLIDFAVASDFSVPLFDHWPKDWVKDLVNNEDGELWMGLLGGTISGSNLPKSQAENPYTYFLNSNKRINSLSSVSYALLGEKPTANDLKTLTDYLTEPSIDSLDIQLHHIDLISPTKIHNDFNYALPFANREVIAYFLSLPFELRKGRGVFKDIILQHFSELGKFPSNRNGGMSLSIVGRKKSILKKIQFLGLKNYNYSGNGKYLSLTNYLGNEQMELYLKEKLSRISDRNFFYNHTLEVLIYEFFSHKNNFVNHSRVIDALVSLELFCDYLYNNEK